MKLKILDTNAAEKGYIELPVQFTEPIRSDLIKRAVLVVQASRRQRYGAFPLAGQRASAYVSKRRRDYKTTYGIGQSRTPRKAMSKSGTRFNWVGAFAPQTVGGRRSHPPKAKSWEQKINEQENRKAIRSALASTVVAPIVKARGHRIPSSYPFVISDDFLNISKTAELEKILLKLGFKEELSRVRQTKVRAGKGKSRGRKHRVRKGILFVTAQESKLALAARNIPGTDTVTINEINVELLAPGTFPGRLTLYTESALKKLNETKLFCTDFQGSKKESAKKEKKVSVEKNEAAVESKSKKVKVAATSDSKKSKKEKKE